MRTTPTNENHKALGGYLELELRQDKQQLYPNGLRFQSARAAFAALLIAGRPRRVWMPKYICNSMLSPLVDTGTEIIFYDLTEQLSVDDAVELEGTDWLLYINYFGVCYNQAEELLTRFNSSQIVFDHSQALFCPPLPALATIYSPRKFFGIPDGGLLVTSMSVKEPDLFDAGSISRCGHLLARLDSGPESGYQEFLRDEASLEDTAPRRMSHLTTALLSSIDYEAASKRRISNFEALHASLAPFNDIEITSVGSYAALCYPLLCPSWVGVDHLRQQLLANRIFVATYWPEVCSRVSPKSFEYRLVKSCLSIPCDQRYVPMDLVSVTEQIARAIEMSSRN